MGGLLPWINATALDRRRAFIAAYLASDDSIADLARRFRVSRKTAHKFINRYERLGDAGLHDLPCAPRSNPRATDPAIAAMIVKAKQDNPILGPKKIIPNLRDDHPDLPWPAPSPCLRSDTQAASEGDMGTCAPQMRRGSRLRGNDGAHRALSAALSPPRSRRPSLLGDLCITQF